MLFALLWALAQPAPLPDTSPRPGLSPHFDLWWTGDHFICQASCYTATKPDGGLYPNLLRAEDRNAQACVDSIRTKAAANCGR